VRELSHTHTYEREKERERERERGREGERERERGRRVNPIRKSEQSCISHICTSQMKNVEI
jgi:hypothetical protein